MKLFGYTFGKTPVPQIKTEVLNENGTILKIMELSRVELPEITEVRNKDWVMFGLDNLYPNKLIKFLSTSGIHNAIVLTKAKMQAGSDVFFDGLKFEDYSKTIEDPKAFTYLKQFYNDPSSSNGRINLNDLAYNLSYDWQIFGAFALEIIWTLDFTRIQSISHIDVSRVRSGKLDEEREVCSYYYSHNWAKLKDNQPIEMAKFDPNNKEDYRQLLYVHTYKPGLDFYGEPGYSAALSWINIDSKMGEFHLSNIDNGFSPSMAIKFFQKPESPEQMDYVAKEVVKQFAGAHNAGKAMVFFSDGKDLAPEITPIQQPQLDNMFMVLGEQVVQQIISGHRVTSPMLMGIATSGKLGYSNELVNAYKIFDKEVIQPDQNVLLRTLNMLAEINGITVPLTIDPLMSVEDLYPPVDVIQNIQPDGTTKEKIKY